MFRRLTCTAPFAPRSCLTVLGASSAAAATASSLRRRFAAAPTAVLAVRWCASSTATAPPPDGSPSASSSKEQSEPAPASAPPEHPYGSVAYVEAAHAANQEVLTKLGARLASYEQQLLAPDLSESGRALLQGLKEIALGLIEIYNIMDSGYEERLEDAQQRERKRVEFTRPVVEWLRRTDTSRSVWGSVYPTSNAARPLFGRMRCRNREMEMFGELLLDDGGASARYPFILLTGTRRHGTTVFLDEIARNKQLVSQMHTRMQRGGRAVNSEKHPRVFNISFSRGYYLERCLPLTVPQAVCEVALRVLASAAGITSEYDLPPELERLKRSLSDLLWQRSSDSVGTVESLIKTPLREAGLLADDAPVIFLFDSLAKLIDCVRRNFRNDHDAGNKAAKALVAELATLLSPNSAVVITGVSPADQCSQADVIRDLELSGHGVRVVPLLPVTDVATRRDMLVMRSALARAAAITGGADRTEAVVYYELLKSSPGPLGALLGWVGVGVEKAAVKASRYAEFLHGGGTAREATPPVCDAVALLSTPGAAQLEHDAAELEKIEREPRPLAINNQHCASTNGSFAFIEPRYVYDVSRWGAKYCQLEPRYRLVFDKLGSFGHEVGDRDCYWVGQERVKTHESVFAQYSRKLLRLNTAEAAVPERVRACVREDALAAVLRFRRACRSCTDQQQQQHSGAGGVPLLIFVGQSAAHVFAASASKRAASDVEIVLSSKFFSACGSDDIFNERRQATELAGPYPVVKGIKRTLQRKDPALARLARLITRHRRGDCADPTQLLLVPKRAAVVAAAGGDRCCWRDSCDVVVFHEYAGAARRGRLVQFIVDVNHGAAGPPLAAPVGSRLLVKRIRDGLGNALLQARSCVVDHVVLVIVAPALPGKLDVSTQLSKRHRSAIRKALGRLQSFHLVVLRPDDDGSGLAKLLAEWRG